MTCTRCEYGSRSLAQPVDFFSCREEKNHHRAHRDCREKHFSSLGQE
jgi:hypothetical protein